MSDLVKQENEVLLALANGSDFYGTKRNDKYEVDPRFIVIKEGHNVRDFTVQENLDSVQELKEDIRVNNVITPLKCIREKIGANDKGEAIYKYIVVDGETRLRAVRELLAEGVAIYRVPVILMPANYNEANLVIEMLSANKGKRLRLIETARGYERLIRMGQDVKEVAKNVGMSEQHVKETLSLLSYNVQIQKELSTGKVTANNIRKVDNSLKETIKDKSQRKQEVEKILMEAVDMAKREGDAVKAGKFLDLRDKSKEDVLASQVENLLSILPNRNSYSRDELVLFAKLLKSGYSIDESIDSVFVDDETNSATGTN